MTDHEFIEFMKDLLLAPDTVIKKAHMERMFSIIAALLSERDGYIKTHRETETALTADLTYWKDIASERIAIGKENEALTTENEHLRKLVDKIEISPSAQAALAEEGKEEV